MGESVSKGKPPHLDPESYDDLVEQIRSSGMVKIGNLDS